MTLKEDERCNVSADGKEGIGSSFWEHQEDAEAYERVAYADVRKTLEPFSAGNPELHKYLVQFTPLQAGSEIRITPARDTSIRVVLFAAFRTAGRWINDGVVARNVSRLAPSSPSIASCKAAVIAI